MIFVSTGRKTWRRGPHVARKWSLILRVEKHNTKEDVISDISK